MNIPRKLELFNSATLSITRHDDEDSTVLKAVIGQMRDLLDAEEAALDERVAARVAEALGVD